MPTFKLYRKQTFASKCWQENDFCLIRQTTMDLFDVRYALEKCKIHVYGWIKIKLVLIIFTFKNTYRNKLISLFTQFGWNVFVRRLPIRPWIFTKLNMKNLHLILRKRRELTFKKFVFSKRRERAVAHSWRQRGECPCLFIQEIIHNFLPIWSCKWGRQRKMWRQHSPSLVTHIANNIFNGYIYII